MKTTIQELDGMTIVTMIGSPISFLRSSAALWAFAMFPLLFFMISQKGEDGGTAILAERSDRITPS